MSVRRVTSAAGASVVLAALLFAGGAQGQADPVDQTVCDSPEASPQTAYSVSGQSMITTQGCVTYHRDGTLSTMVEANAYFRWGGVWFDDTEGKNVTFTCRLSNENTGHVLIERQQTINSDRASVIGCWDTIPRTAPGQYRFSYSVAKSDGHWSFGGQASPWDDRVQANGGASLLVR
jgi:hypothetical protein